MVNLDVFLTPIKANIAYLYRFHGDRLTFLSFDMLPYHIGIRTKFQTLVSVTDTNIWEQVTGFEPVLPAWQADVLTTNTTPAYPIWINIQAWILVHRYF